MLPSEIPIDEQVRASIAPAASEGAALLKISVEESPEKIVAAIHKFVARPSKPWFKKVDNWTDRALPLGSLWGQQMIRAFDWEWSFVVFHDHDDSKATGVFSKDRSLAVYPFHFIFGCLENNAPVTIDLAFNMLVAGKIPRFSPNEFQNLMEGVHHIVPQ